MIRILNLSPAPMWDVEDKKGMPSIYLTQKGFVEAGHEVLYAFPGKETRSYDYEGIHMHEFRLQVPIAPPQYPWLHRLSMKFFSLSFLVVATIKGLQLCRVFQPDVVYGHFYAAPVAWIIGRIQRIPNITRLYGTFLLPWLHSVWGRIRKIEEVVAFKTPCSYLIMTNDGMKSDECAVALGVPIERMKFWRNGVNKDMFDPFCDKDKFKESLAIPRHHKVILAVSRLVNWKRVDRLITALPMVLQQYPHTTAVVVGDGEERDRLESLCRQLGVTENVRFVGLILHEEVAQFLNAADIFVSLYEHSNVGNPLLEALCCGKCIVSINNGGTGEINRHGEVVILLEETGLKVLPEVLVDLLRNDAKRERLGQAAREYALQHLQTWPERIKMEVNLIEELVSGSQKYQLTHQPSVTR